MYFKESMSTPDKSTLKAVKAEESKKLAAPSAHDDNHRYNRYHIETKPAPDIVPYPSRFLVKVKKIGLARLILKELFHYRANMPVILSRPCVYGVFSGPIGGFAPRPQLCVGCLRCTTKYPEFVQIYPNPERQRLGDSYFTSSYVDTVTSEAQTGRIPVKGAGYRGKFGGEGWDGMWTDMSEIVRPTRDGIHGREFISTVADIGEKLSYLTFDEAGLPTGVIPRTLEIPLPILLDVSPAMAAPKTLLPIFSQAAREIEILFVAPLSAVRELGLSGRQVVPLIAPEDRALLGSLSFQPTMIELAGWNEKLYQEVRSRFPESIVCPRLGFAEGFAETLRTSYQAGVRVFHLTANYHGRGSDGRFVLDLIREAHLTFVEAGCRDKVTLIGSGGIIAAEHVPKAIICGLDAVALDTALLVALQGKMLGECLDNATSRFEMPNIPMEWGVQRLKNLMATWRDQLLEIMGAMGMREVRRLRGEIGRAMFQKDLEQEAFAGITGYANS